MPTTNNDPATSHDTDGGLARQLIGRNRDELGMARALLGPAEDLVADGERAHAVADRLHHAGEVGPLARRERRRPALVQAALADRDLARVDPRCLDRHEHLPRGRRPDPRPRAPRARRRRRTRRIALPSCHLLGQGLMMTIATALTLKNRGILEDGGLEDSTHGASGAGAPPGPSDHHEKVPHHASKSEVRELSSIHPHQSHTPAGARVDWEIFVVRDAPHPLPRRPHRHDHRCRGR